MNFLEIFLIAVGLAMDTFAVSITLGLSVRGKAQRRPTLAETIIPGAYFGFFQALMPIIGYYAGRLFADMMQSVDHWVAFILLVIIGGKMIKDSLPKKGAETKTAAADDAADGDVRRIFGFNRMLVLALATSIDALSVGVSFAFLNVRLPLAALTIGAATLVISSCGVLIGNVSGIKLRAKAEFAGGAVLVAIGLKILLEHMLG
ncbi:MAG: manganese efflux pump MntP family protein [Oscillospiraceae bacterium]|jgi:putative Mn2+ efflux pump MntP|nr:manganese efflux pump MntP family protein [Oscillospiraceae bacterium]